MIQHALLQAIDTSDATVQAGAYLVLFTLTLLAMGVGCVIAFQAYRGYRRNGSRPMFYLAVGLVLLTVVPFLVSIVFTTIGRQLGASPFFYEFALPIVSRLIELLGLGSILYSLYMRR